MCTSNHTSNRSTARPLGKLAVAAIILLSAASARAIPSLHIDVDPLTFGIQTVADITTADFTVDIVVTGVEASQRLYAFAISVANDAGVIEPTSAIEGPFLPSGGPTDFSDLMTANDVRVIDSLTGMIPGVAGDRVLFSIVYHVLTEGISDLSFSLFELADDSEPPAAAMIPVEFANGGARIQVGAVPLPSSLLLVGLGLVGFSLARYRAK